MVVGIFSLLLTALGDLLIGISVFKVHTKMASEKGIDNVVINEMRTEKKLVVTGMIFIAVGMVLGLYKELLLLGII